MMNLMKENEENKRSMLLSVICSSITVIAVCSLIMIASLVGMPAAARIAVILLAVATAVAGISAAVMLDVRAGYYECPHCGTQFVPTVGEYVRGYHTFTSRRLTCPSCGQREMCRRRIIRR